MKIKKFIIAIALIVTVGVSTACTINQINIVDAKTNIAVFPKKMRGKWYSYSNYSNKVNKQIITKKRFKANEAGDKYTRYLHVNPTGCSYDYYKRSNNKKINWVYFSNRAKAHGRNWLALRGWYQSAGAASYFNLSKLNGHQVLTIAGGAGVWGSEHYYRSQKLAKQLKNQRYSGFKY